MYIKLQISVTVKKKHIHRSKNGALWDLVPAFFSYPLFMKVHHHGQFTDKHENGKKVAVLLQTSSQFCPFFQKSLQQQEYLQINTAR